jgi:hypothetical protein
MEQHLWTDAPEVMRDPKFVPLGLPAGATRPERLAFKRLCTLLADVSAGSDVVGGHEQWTTRAKLGDLYGQPTLAAAAHIAIDLVDQGWTVQVDKLGALFAPPLANGDRENEKARIRRQEHLRRDQQLRKPSVRRFVEGMERAHYHGGRMLSVFNLMRDGRELADALRAADAPGSAIRPYLQIVDSSCCELTGFRLHDIWRYFRHTWSNAYATVPGRSMAILIRDAATDSHAVIGLAAISSPVVQIAERDNWMGWETDQFIASIQENPTIAVARWVSRRIKTHLDEIYVEDLLLDGVLEPTDITRPTPDAIARLRADAERHRQRHQRMGAIRQVRNIEIDAWVERAETDLFRSKRSASLAEALEIACFLGCFLAPRPSVKGLTEALDNPRARSQLRRVIRRARGERVGTVVADLTVCGAVAPYNALAAGKLVGALAASPKVLAAYKAKYSRPSEIASAMAGRPIIREARLAFIGTTSLYGTGSSQYNRLYWPADVMGGDGDSKLGFYALGRSRSFGTSHFSDETVEALVRFSTLSGLHVRVNSLFGEGVSPRLRKVRVGLAALGWPADELLKHGRERILYGVPLVRNLAEYSLGVQRDPDYLLDPDLENSDTLVADWWLERWCRGRAEQEAVIAAMREHQLVRPVNHGARVPLPVNDGTQVEATENPDVAVGG